MVQATIKSDIYELYYKDDKNFKFYDTAFIDSFKINGSEEGSESNEEILSMISKYTDKNIELSPEKIIALIQELKEIDSTRLNDIISGEPFSEDTEINEILKSPEPCPGNQLFEDPQGLFHLWGDITGKLFQ